MNPIKWLLNFYTFSAVDDDGGGDAPVDRGDDVNDLVDAIDDTGAADPVDESADDEGEEEAAQPRDKDGKFTKKGAIPVDRHEAVLNKERQAREAAEARAAALEQQIRQVSMSEDLQRLEQDIETVEDLIETARLEGDKDKARELSKQLRLMERQVRLAENTQMSQTAKDQAREEMRLDLTIEKLELEYDVLREGSDDYDQDAVDMVLAMQRDLINRERMMPSKALATAASRVMARLVPPSNDGGKPDGLKAAKGAEDRKQAQVAKNIQTAKKQPPSTKEVGLDSDKAGQKGADADVSQMSFDEFAALPEATKAKLRGDLI